MIDPAAACWVDLGIGRPKIPTRKRVIRVTPLLFLAPECWLIGGLTLESAVTYYRHLVASAKGFDGVRELLSGRGTCCGSVRVDPICLTPTDKKKPSILLCEKLSDRFRHALLGPYRGQVPAWRTKMGLTPERYTVTQRLFLSWRYDVTGERMKEMIDALGALALRTFRSSPNEYHPGAIHAHDVTIEFDAYGYTARLYYSYKDDPSCWNVRVRSIKGETFAEFVERAIGKLTEALEAKGHVHDYDERSRIEREEWEAHVGPTKAKGRKGGTE